MKTIIDAYKKYYWIALLAISAIGISFDLILTRRGAGASGDSVWYLQGAENLLKGIGYGILRSDGFIRNTLYPPFYSFTLAGLSLTGFSLFAAARLLNALLLGITIYMIGWLVHQLTRSSTASIITACFILLSFDFLSIHTWVMSEPMYIFLSIGCFILLYEFQNKGKRVYLYTAGFLAGLSVLTRYIGIALVAAICLWVLIFDQRKFKYRLLDTFIIFIFGVLPTIVFLLWGTGQAQSAGRSDILFRLIPRENLGQMERAFLNWYSPLLGSYIPNKFEHFAEIILFLISISPYILYFKSIKREPDDEAGFLLQNQWLYIFYMGIYLFTIILSISLSLAGNPSASSLNQVLRYILPIYPIFVLFMAIMVYLYYRRLSSFRIAKHIPLGVVVLLAVVLLINFIVQVKLPQSYGYTDIKNNSPELVVRLQSFSASRPVITNNYELAYFLIEKPVYTIPGQGNELTGKPDPNYNQSMDHIRKLISDDAVVVMYRTTPDSLVPYQSLLVNLQVIQTYNNITLYSTSGQ